MYEPMDLELSNVELLVDFIIVRMGTLVRIQKGTRIRRFCVSFCTLNECVFSFGTNQL